MGCSHPSRDWFVYLLVSATDGRTYVGITTDVARRLAQHNGAQAGGARSTRAGRPWRVAACSPPLPDRSTALRFEHRVKRLRGTARARRVAEGWSAAVADGSIA
jgi:predicted GIY-YIG superfamily endonuclease